MRLLVFLLASLVSFAAWADEGGYLYLQAHDAIARRDGAQPGTLFVYDLNGESVWAEVGGTRSPGQFAPGQMVPLPAGEYFVQVGRYRERAGLKKIRVVEGHVTIVPSGWVQVWAIPLNEQPRDCSQWNAELTAFAEGLSGERLVISSNQGTGVRTWGAMQLMVGPVQIYFNDLPLVVEVQADQAVEFPTGFQGPITGSRPMLSTVGGESAEGAQLNLCESGNVQVPAGEYWASGTIPIESYPYEQRQYTQVRVEPVNLHAPENLRTPRLRVPIYDGEGAIPVEPTEEERARLDAEDASPTGIRLTIQ